MDPRVKPEDDGMFLSRFRRKIEKHRRPLTTLFRAGDWVS